MSDTFSGKEVVKALEVLGAKSALIVDAKENKLLSRGAKNLPAAKWLAPDGLNVYDVLDHEHLILTSDSARKVEAALKP